jgi:hypothetical protein
MRTFAIAEGGALVHAKMGCGKWGLYVATMPQQEHVARRVSREWYESWLGKQIQRVNVSQETWKPQFSWLVSSCLVHRPVRRVVSG